MNLDEQIEFIETSRQTCADFGTTLGERNYTTILASLRELKRLRERLAPITKRQQLSCECRGYGCDCGNYNDAQQVAREFGGNCVREEVRAALGDKT